MGGSCSYPGCDFDGIVLVWFGSAQREVLSCAKHAHYFNEVD